jgi:hypothetical protein
VALLPVVLAGCPIENTIPEPPPAIVQCEGAGYTAFDVAHHAEQDERLAGASALGGLLEEAIETPVDAAAKFSEAFALYQGSADLQAKVQGRTDDRIDGRPVVGDAIDARIVAAFAAGGAATTRLEVEIAAETIDKALTEFWFLSVFHEMVQGQAAKWDEAYGYYGSGADNVLDDVQGFASLAKKRDANNGTAFEAAIFQSLVDGSCTLATRLQDDDVETIDVLNDSDMSAIIGDVDIAMRQVLAASIGHEAFEIGEIKEALAAAPDDVDLAGEARVKLVEADGFFRPLERLLRAEGDTVTADTLRAHIDGGLDDDTAAWITGFDDDDVIATLEAAFAIEVIE